MYRYSKSLLIVVLSVLLCLGCSHGQSPTAPNPTGDPGIDSTLSESQVPQDSMDQIPCTFEDEGRFVLGVWKLSRDEAGNVSVVPLRQGAAPDQEQGHWNATDEVQDPLLCPGCFGWSISGIGEIVTLTFSLQNNFTVPITIYDPRITILREGDGSDTQTLLSEPDSYTKYFHPCEPYPWCVDSQAPNPFFIMDSGIGNNEWPPGASAVREILFHWPTGTPWEVNFIVDVAYPENQEEPVKIYNIDFSQDTLIADGVDSTDLTCQVHDWGPVIGANGVEEVKVDLSPFGGGVQQMTNTVGDTWVLEDITCEQFGGAEGEFPLLITAVSDNGNFIKWWKDETYNYATIEIIPTPLPAPHARWTYLLYANDFEVDYYMNQLEQIGSVWGDINFIVLRNLGGTAGDALMYVLDGHSNVIPDNGAVVPLSGGLDMSDPQTLANFIRYTLTNFPADDYILDMNSHGSGLFSGFCSGMKPWEVGQTCEQVLAELQLDPFDCIWFHSCFMGWLECIWAVRNSTDHFIGSELLGVGSNYVPVYWRLRYTPGYTGEQFTHDVVEEFSVHDSTYRTYAGISLSEFNQNVVPALQNFTLVTTPQILEIREDLADCRHRMGLWDDGADLRADIGDFMYKVSIHPNIPQDVKDAAANVKSAIDDANVNVHLSHVPAESCAWAVWFPWNIHTALQSKKTQYYDINQLNMVPTLWPFFLERFGMYGELPDYGWVEKEDTLFLDFGNGIIEPGEMIDFFLTVRCVQTEFPILTNVQATLSEHPDYQGIYTIAGGVSDYEWMETDLLYTNLTPFTIIIGAGVAAGTVAVINATFTCDQLDPEIVPVSFVVMPHDILVLDLDHDSSSAPAIVNSIIGNGYLADLTDLPIKDAPIEDFYENVFISMGMYEHNADNYVPDYFDFTTIERFLNSGNTVYLEGGDAWFYHPQLRPWDFCTLFDIKGDRDGWQTTNLLIDEPGLGLAGPFSYLGDDSNIDHIDSAILLLSAECDEFYFNNYCPFSVMAAYNSGVYRTVGSSVEFGGIDPADQVAVMDAILANLGL